MEALVRACRMAKRPKPRSHPMAQSRLDACGANPAGDWTIEDVAALCREHDYPLHADASGGRSDWKVFDPTQREILTTPNRRPVNKIEEVTALGRPVPQPSRYVVAME